MEHALALIAEPWIDFLDIFAAIYGLRGLKSRKVPRETSCLFKITLFIGNISVS